jgi:hypothetical protein
MLEGSEAICLFVFAQSDNVRKRPSEAVDERLILRRVGSIAALIGAVPISDYCGAAGERNLADAAWIAPRVRRHAELVECTMRLSPVFPIPFGTLYKSFDSLAAFMRAHEESIGGFLQRVADKEEWELRACARFDSPEILDRLACDAWPEWRALTKGVRYMRACRDRDALLDVGRAAAAARVREFVAELRPLAASVRQHDPGRRLDPGAGEPIARYAFLVERSNADEVRARVKEIAVGASRQNIGITLSGPWPPFSFRPDLSAPNQAMDGVS